MFVNRLKIHNFRNIIEQEYFFKQNINIFYGKNGAGKTSILEAINFLSSGKSFRKGNYKSLINFNADTLTVYLEYSDGEISSSLAVNKHQSGQWQANKNSNKIKKQSEIISSLPVVAIDPEVYRLVDFGPLYRRNFLDWLVFHVEHSYLDLWKKVYKCVKQLNVLYKSKSSGKQIDLWEKSFILFSDELNEIRKVFFNRIKPHILKLSIYMQEEITDLSIIYKQGWSHELSLTEQLRLDRDKNVHYGQLQHGPQKMDIKITTGKLPAAQTLSRGQKKVLSITFYMAYITLLLENTPIKPILCLDDFDAEIDNEKLLKAAKFFEESKTQIFITTVHKEKIEKVFTEAQMFHVEH
ncbi:DNA recombination and repair protein RecF [hydrothermal vent metagenome]|uniref:DNA recombination and repair protein RecF n=1 Tax=hydrothermal vent metagenome TaxID=652676 RepID=A0A3B0VCC0_9ZZZZ